MKNRTKATFAVLNEKGGKVSVEAVGEDAEKAVAALLKLAKNRFNVKY